MRGEDINSIESESGIIASLIHNPEFYFYSENLLPNHFTNKDNRYVYAAISELVKQGITNIDAFNIIECLNSSQSTRKYGEELSVDKLQEFIEMSEILARHSIEEYKMLVRNVLDVAFRKDAFQQLERCKSMCMDMSIDNLSQQIYSALDATIGEYTEAEDVPEFKDVVDDLWSDIELRQHSGVGLEWQFPSLNDYVTLEPGELVVVAAPQKGGKSIILMNAAVEALKKGESVMYIDSELSDRLFLMRLVSYISEIEFRRIKYGAYNSEEKQRIVDAITWIKSKKFVHLYMPTFNSTELYINVMKIYHRFNGLGLLVCDYLKSTSDGDAYAVYNELGKVSDTIKNNICGKLKIPGLAAAQLTSTGKLSDSAKIARNASSVLLLQDKTPEEMDEDGENGGNKKLIVKYNRNGAQMVDGEWINLIFQGDLCRFSEAKERHIPQTPY